jgi:hypothetical protein
MCQDSITTLNATTATQGRSSQPPAARNGRDQPVPSAAARSGIALSSGCHGAPATISVGAANISSRCWTMCMKK